MYDVGNKGNLTMSRNRDFGPRRPSHQGARHAYSLIEMLITILIIQVIAGMIGVSVSTVASTERTSFASQEIITALRYARQLAQTSGTPCGVIFDSVNQQVKVFRGNTSTIAANTGMPGGQYIINLTQQADTGGVQLSTISLAGPASNNVVTYGNIGATSGEAKGLGSTANSGFVIVQRGTATKTITIPHVGEATAQ